MRIPSAVTDQYIYFVAVDATDLKTRETGLATWTVYRSRDGAASAVFTTPTINETDVTNMPGVYELLLDEDMTIAAGNDSEEFCVHITHAGMAPVTRVFELYRPKFTAGATLAVTDIVSSGAITTLTGAVVNVDLVDTLTTYTGNTVQTGDSFARIGVAGAGLTNIDLPNQTMDITGSLSGSVGSIGAGGIATTSFAAGAIDAAAIAANAIGASEFAQAAADKVFASTGAVLAELAQAAPSATPRPDEAIMLLYMAMRNKLDVTATTKNISNNAGTVISKKALTDDGVTYSEAEMVTGP